MSPIDRFAHTNRWRERALTEKAALGFGLLIVALAIPGWSTSVAVLVVATLATVVGAEVPLRAWAWSLTVPLGFILVGSVPLMVEIGPEGLGIAPQGVEASAGVTLRSIAAMSGLLFLALTTPATDLVASMRRLGVPAEVTEIAMLTYRFLFLLADTARAMNAAQARRLGHSGIRSRIRCAGLVAANLLPRALDRARRMEIGLAARGWNGSLAVLSPERPVAPGGIAAVLATLTVVAMVGSYGR
jgi:cobalt/nickel transport system permease protein